MGSDLTSQPSAYSFDTVIDRSASHSTKWRKFAPDVLPMWVADMDFAAPPFIIETLRARLDHPILGYTDRPASLNDAFRGWLAHHFDWQVPAEWIVWLPGVVPGLNLACRTMPADAAIMIPTPVYHPFLALAENAGLGEQRVAMRREGRRWHMDFDAMQAAITPNTRMLLICNPQNPTGRAYTRGELAELAQFVSANDLLLVSDEIHCSIVLDEGARHLPVAAAFPEIAERTINLFAATKVYNVPGIGCAAAVIPETGLRKRYLDARAGLVPGIGPLGFAVSEAAFNDRSDWVATLRDYLRDNYALVRGELGERVAPLDATYLAWIDVSDLNLDDTEAHFARHGVGISPGAQFGEPGFIRVNFGCPRSTLTEGLRRIRRGLGNA